MYEKNVISTKCATLCLASKDLWPRNSIRLSLIRIISDPRIRTLVRTRERHQTTRARAPATRNLELMTSRVELSTGVAVSRVKCDNLVANEVISRLDTFRDGVFGDTTGFHERSSSPCVGCALAAFFFDFEPHGVGFGHVVVAACRGTLSHVRDNGLEESQEQFGKLRRESCVTPT
jgi:hypothetical protein